MIIQGDCLEVLKTLESKSINCCVTSPPYYNQRDYGVEGQIGLEPSPFEYIDKLVEVFREVRRVLQDDGTLWINIADTYCSTAPGSMGDPYFIKECHPETNAARKKYRGATPEGMKKKDLMGIPWMLAFALRADGWYLRQDIIWHKPNPMPESVKDRCTKAHEYIFLLSKAQRYYYDHEAIKEPCVGFNNVPPAGSEGSAKPNSRRRKGNNKTFRGGGVYTGGRSFDNSGGKEKDSVGNVPNETGMRNRRDVWTVATRGYKGAHFATFPAVLIRPCLLAGCPVGGTALDPFFGSGTVGQVALEQGKDFVGIELNPDYCELSRERTQNAQIVNSAQGGVR